MNNKALISDSVRLARISHRLYLRYARAALPLRAAHFRAEAYRYLHAARQLKEDAR